MNSYDIDRFLKRRLRDFDGVFSASTICPKILICWCAIRTRLTNPVVIGSLSTSKMGVETFSTRLDGDRMLFSNVI